MQRIWPRALAIVGALIVASAAPAAAELTKQAGILAGYNFSTLRIDGVDNIEGRSTFAIGGVLDLGINERLGIRIEPTWINNGAKSTQRNNLYGTNDGIVFKLDYIGVPVLARYDLSIADTRPYLLGGVAVSFATKREAEITQGLDTQTIDVAEVLSSTDFSVDLGAGVSFPVGGNRLTIDGRAAIGLADIAQNGTIVVNGTPQNVLPPPTHNLAFRLFATYLFALGAR